MRRYAVFPILALGGGCAAFVLRLLQWRTGFEPDTGLPIPGTPFGVLTAALAALVMVLCVLLRKKLPAETEGTPLFPAGFAADPGILTLAVAGVFLMAAAGLADIAAGMGVQALPGMADLSAVSRREQLILGMLTLAAAVCLFPAIPACRAADREAPGPSTARCFWRRWFAWWCGWYFCTGRIPPTRSWQPTGWSCWHWCW